MKDLRIVFMGTPEFAVASLDALCMAGANVVGVITSPDKPSGRGRKLNSSAVKKYAVTNDLPLLQPTNLKDPQFLAELKALQPDVQVVVAFRMLPEVVWGLPSKGTFNLHGSLLPQYRGAAPIHWAVINGEKNTGVTTFFIDHKIDTGDIIDSAKIEISETATTGDIHDRLMELGAALVVKTVKAIADGTVKTVPQSKELHYSPAPKLNQDNTRIDWSLPLIHIYNKVRGLNPFPGAWAELLNGDEPQAVKILSVGMRPDSHDLETGTIITTKKEILVATPEGFIQVLEIKVPGKRLMDAKSLLNGFSFVKNAQFM
ncbi:MAG: methionyl-tRNA formyltransferase [Gilvibacter sp.]